MIAYSKIRAVYSKDEIYKMFPIHTARKIIFHRSTIKINVLVKYCNFKKINYTLNDLQEDYPNFANYKGAEIAYKIYSQGSSITDFWRKHQIGPHLENLIRSGIDFNSTVENGYKIIKFMEYKINIKMFKVDKYDTHVELFGEKEDLIKFKEKYNLRFEVIYEPYKKSWHLAFNGMLAEYIKVYKK